MEIEFTKPSYESQSHFVIEGIEITSKVKLHTHNYNKVKKTKER